MDKSLLRKSRYLTKLLRHDPEELSMDRKGFVDVKQVLKKLDIKLSQLELIVKSDNKGRFYYNKSIGAIRANQGHSIDVDVELEEKVPPDTLFHGTATRFLSSIYEKGIIKGNRKFVHLSKDKKTAEQVGSRHGKVFILAIDTKKMFKDGYKFYLSKNNVWLIDFIPRKYII